MLLSPTLALPRASAQSMHLNNRCINQGDLFILALLFKCSPQAAAGLACRCVARAASSTGREASHAARRLAPIPAIQLRLASQFTEGVTSIRKGHTQYE